MEAPDALVLDAWDESDFHIAIRQSACAVSRQRRNYFKLAFQRTWQKKAPQWSGVQIACQRYTKL
jgi:hypothetical protein